MVKTPDIQIHISVTNTVIGTKYQEHGLQFPQSVRMYKSVRIYWTTSNYIADSFTQTKPHTNTHIHTVYFTSVNPHDTQHTLHKYAKKNQTKQKKKKKKKTHCDDIYSIVLFFVFKTISHSIKNKTHHKKIPSQMEWMMKLYIQTHVERCDIYIRYINVKFYI